MATARVPKGVGRYSALLAKIFTDRFKQDMEEVAFLRSDLVRAAGDLGVQPPKNLGDVLYSNRYRANLPEPITSKQPEGLEWIIMGTGIAAYTFKLVPIVRIVPNPNLVKIKIPDATPEIISAYALSDEQATLAKIRYNRLLDIFLGMACYSLQNHLRTTVKDMGQIEIDEVYVGIDKRGRQFALPVQAKGGKDRLAIVQTIQDLRCCAEKFPGLICRPISTQFMGGNDIALFELTLEGDRVRVVEERHYTLVPGKSVTPQDLKNYGVWS
jgi:hypothetical protein